MTKHWTVFIAASLAALVALLALVGPAQADIFQWEYINPANPSLGKQRSTMLAPDGAGVDAAPGADLSHRDLTMANLIGADLTGAFATVTNLTNADLSQANLTNAYFFGYGDEYGIYGTDLTGANLSQANLTNARYENVTLTGANLTGAQIRGAKFLRPVGVGGVSIAQLYSTASYLDKDLMGIWLTNHYLTGVNFAGQNLTNASFFGATLTNANFSQANLATADFYAATLTGADLRQANLANANFAGFVTYDELGNEYIFPGADLTNAIMSGADARGASFQYAIFALANANNLIQSNGKIWNLDLTAGASLVIRDYDGNPAGPPTGTVPIFVEQQMAMDVSGTLRLEIDADAWDSTISFAPGIPVALGGTLELAFAPGVDVAAQSGRTIDLFDWTGVNPTGAFTVSSPYSWDLASLYTTGEVTLTAGPGFIPGDFNGDSVVDSADLAPWKTGFGTIGNAGHAHGDADADHDVDGADFLAWQRQLGSPASVTASTAEIPEPASLLLVIVAAASLRRLGGRVHRELGNARRWSISHAFWHSQADDLQNRVR